jgi:hypothetical protein
MKIPRIIYPLLLAFALLFVQQSGAAHGIRHALAEQKQDQSLPHDTVCELCALYAQVAGAPSSTAVSFGLLDLTDAFHLAFFEPLPSATFSAFSARAPPFSR